MGFIAELKRRNVFRVGIAYVIVAWVLLQIADVLFPALTLPDSPRCRVFDPGISLGTFLRLGL